MFDLVEKMSSIRKVVVVFAALWYAAAGIVYVSAAQPQVTVTVLDEAGRVLADASVSVGSALGDEVRCVPSDSLFICPASDTGAEIVVRAPGFTEARRGLSGLPGSGGLTIVLTPIPISEKVVISASRVETRIGDTPVSVSLLGRPQIENSAASSMDDILRQLPGFSIFRRSSSRHANPTTQGVSLRGVGSSGASRTLVLSDGVPLNDTFGGWVQWNRVVPIAIEQVEVVRGGASSLFGSGSLSGTVNAVPRRADAGSILSAETFGGSQGTFSGSLFAGSRVKNWSIDGVASHGRTTGYVLTEPISRGPVDMPAGFRASNLRVRVETDLADGLSVFFRPAYFSESRTNGTPLQTNRTVSRDAVLGGRAAGRRGGIGRSGLAFDWRIFGGTQGYDQSFSAVGSGRLTENLTRLQRSPSRHFGVSTQFSAVAGPHTIVGGFEARGISGSSNEVVFAGGGPSLLVGSGGRERSVGLFLQDIFSISDRVLISASVRFDRWEMLRGLASTRDLASGTISATEFPDRSETAISPRFSLLVRASDNISVHVSASRSFRAPTLNELYRGFRVGNVVTEANENLQAERAFNFESGASVTFGLVSFRATAFVVDVTDAIGNVTISSTPTLITRQRMNAGRTRSVGFESDAEIRLRGLTLNAGYQFADSTVAAFPTNPDLIGLRVPQVARNQFTAQAAYHLGRWSFAVQSRASGEQFDDDLNAFRLEPFIQTDVFASGRIARRLTLFFSVENITNSRYSVGRTPLRTIGAPVGFRTGLRWH